MITNENSPPPPAPAPRSFIKTKAAVAWKPNEPLTIETLDLMLPLEDEVLIRLEAAALCHTDAYTLSGKDPEGNFPVVLGHEGSGVIVQLGPQWRGWGTTAGSRFVASSFPLTDYYSTTPYRTPPHQAESSSSPPAEIDLQVGDHVIPLYTPECFECKFCRSGKTNLCQAIRQTQGRGLMPDSTTRFFKDGRPIHHYMGCSCFSEFIVMPKIAVAKISRQAPLREVCLLGCGITTGIGAVQITAKIEPGSNVAIFGLGPVGLAAVMAARISKANIIIAIDIDETKFLLAKQLGATYCLHPEHPDNVVVKVTEVVEPELAGPGIALPEGGVSCRELWENRLIAPQLMATQLPAPVFSTSLVERIIELTDGGVDYSFECVGNVRVMRQALEACHKGWGQSIIIGVAGGSDEISTRPFQLVTGRVWKGSAFGGVKGRSQLPQYVDRYLAGEFSLKPFITHTLPLEQINEAFKLLHEGKSLKTIITFT